MKKISEIIAFLKKDLWRIRIDSLTGLKLFFIKTLRTIVLAARGFAEDECKLRAAALTLFSLLSIVPIAALAFGIAKGFGLEKILERQLLIRFEAQEEIMVHIINFANSLLETTRGGMVAGIGVIFLMWLVISILVNIEKAFNSIWGLKEGRSLGRKFSDYISIMFICPIIFIASSSITMAIIRNVEYITQRISLLGALSPVIFIFVSLLPLLFICFLFTFIYVFMPNTKVNLKSGIIAGIIAGIIYQLVQWGYINSQIAMTKYNAIYGSFAALPLFLIWLKVSWFILFFGAEISFAHQNVDTYEFEPDCLDISYSFKKLVSLRIYNLLAKEFQQGRVNWTAEKISRTLDIPIRLVRQVLYDLQKADLVMEVRDNQCKTVIFQPCKNVNEISIKDIIDFLENQGGSDVPVKSSEEFSSLSNCLKSFDEIIKSSPVNKKIVEI